MTAVDKPAPTTRSAADVLAWSRNLVEPALRKAIDTMPDAMRLMGGYHLGYWDEHGNPTAGDGGKAIRPALVLLSAKAVGGDPAAAIPGAVAIELVHNFSLLHDDVMDGDLTRRHRRTVWSVFGRRRAILAGDALLTLAYDVLTASGHPGVHNGIRMISAAVLELLRGQHADLIFERRGDVGLDECERMAEGKTGALLGCSCAVGALLGGGTGDQVERFRLFGERIGLAFQHFDDLLGIWGDPVTTGKPVYSDLDNRKKSLPVVAALASDTEAGREFEELYGQDAPLSATELVRAAELIELAGGRAWSQSQTELLTLDALDHLRLAEPVAEAELSLRALASLMTHRDR